MTQYFTRNLRLKNLTVQALIDVSGASAGQIKFPATQNASSDVNTLDDYEEFTWTPVLTCVTVGNLSVTHSAQIGDGTKIGKETRLSFFLSTSAFTHTTAGGNVRVTGSPFTTETIAGGYIWVGALEFGGITKANYTNFNTRMGSATNIINLGASGSAQARTTVAITDMPTGGTPSLVGALNFTATD